MTTDIFPPIDHGRTADAVVRQIELLLLEGVLRVGERLPGERDMARQFDVSRPILREALKTLEARGLISTRPGGGTHVADVIGEVFSGPLAALIARHGKATHDYLEYRRDIEATTAEYAALRATEADKALLIRTVEAMKSAYAIEDFEREAELDVEFHSTVGECAHNIVLLHTLRSCYRLLSQGVFYNRAMIYAFPGTRQRLLEQHMAISQAVMDGDAKAARAASQRHIDFVSDSVRAAGLSDERERVSQLRLRQRSRGLQETTAVPSDRPDRLEATQ